MLRTDPIAARDRLIVALDVPSPDAALAFVEQLGDAVTFYKLGLELFMAGGYFELIDALRARGCSVFADLKFFDVPQTVAAAVRQLRGRGITFATVHGNDAMMAAAAGEKGDVKILAVTCLTSLDAGDLRDLGFETDVRTLVLSRARRAIDLGCDGVISSGEEIALLRQTHGHGFFVVVPGIRPVENRGSDDQKRVVDVEDAFRDGADYIVVGRPIRTAVDPRAAALSLQARIAAVFA